MWPRTDVTRGRQLHKPQGSQATDATEQDERSKEHGSDVLENFQIITRELAASDDGELCLQMAGDQTNHQDRNLPYRTRQGPGLMRRAMGRATLIRRAGAESGEQKPHV